MSVRKYEFERWSSSQKSGSHEKLPTDTNLQERLAQEKSVEVDLQKTLISIAENSHGKERQQAYQKLLEDIDVMNHRFQQDHPIESTSLRKAALERVKEELQTSSQKEKQADSQQKNLSLSSAIPHGKALGFLTSLSPSQLLAFLHQESSQNIALVLQYLTSSQKRTLLQLIPLKKKQAIVDYYANTPPSTVKKACQELKDHLQRRWEEEYSAKDWLIEGFEALIALLKAMPKDKGFSLYQQLQEEFPLLEERLLENFYSVETFLKLTPQEAHYVLSSLPAFDIAVLLKNRDTVWQDQIKNNLSRTKLQWVEAEQQDALTPSWQDVQQAERKLQYAMRTAEKSQKILLYPS